MHTVKKISSSDLCADWVYDKLEPMIPVYFEIVQVSRCIPYFIFYRFDR